MEAGEFTVSEIHLYEGRSSTISARLTDRAG